MHLEEALIRASGSISVFGGITLAILLFRLEGSRTRSRRWLIFFAIYVLIVIYTIAAARGVQAYLVWRVDSFDLNGNGIFEPAEPFGAYGYLLHHMVADTGRAMVFVTAPVLAPFLLLFSYGVYRLIRLCGGLTAKL